MKVRCSLFLLTLLCALAMSSPSFAAQDVAAVKSVVGQATVQRGNETITVVDGLRLLEGDLLTTGAASVAKVRLADGSEHVIWSDSRIRMDRLWVVQHDQAVTVVGSYRVLVGKAKFFFKPNPTESWSRVATANAVFGIRGTALTVLHPDEKTSELQVHTGRVSAYNPKRPKEMVEVNAGRASIVRGEEPPSVPVVIPSETENPQQEKEPERLIAEPAPPPEPVALPLWHRVHLAGGPLVASYANFAPSPRHIGAGISASARFHGGKWPLALLAHFSTFAFGDGNDGRNANSGTITAGVAFPFFLSRGIRVSPLISSGVGHVGVQRRGVEAKGEVLGRDGPVVRYGVACDFFASSLLPLTLEFAAPRFVMQGRFKNTELTLRLGFQFGEL